MTLVHWLIVVIAVETLALIAAGVILYRIGRGVIQIGDMFKRNRFK